MKGVAPGGQRSSRLERSQSRLKLVRELPEGRLRKGEINRTPDVTEFPNRAFGQLLDSLGMNEW